MKITFTEAELQLLMLKHCESFHPPESDCGDLVTVHLRAYANIFQEKDKDGREVIIGTVVIKD